MNLPAYIAKNFRDVHFGGNWTAVNLRDTLKDLTWQQATTKAGSFNTIAMLVYHTHYFVHVTLQVLQGGPLEGNDKFSFDHPPILSEADWQQLLNEVWSDAETFANLVEQLPPAKVFEPMADAKYGTWYRNLHGIVEHTHYHLGQISLIKKALPQG